MARGLTADELMQGIANAIKARDFDAAIDILKVLALVDPRQAQNVLDAMGWAHA